MEEALESYNRALKIDPDQVDANFNASLTKLCMGDFAKAGSNTSIAGRKRSSGDGTYSQPMWRGERELKGKTDIASMNKVSATRSSSCAMRRWWRRAARK